MTTLFESTTFDTKNERTLTVRPLLIFEIASPVALMDIIVAVWSSLTLTSALLKVVIVITSRSHPLPISDRKLF